MALRQILTLLEGPPTWTISLTANVEELPGLTVSIMAFVALFFHDRMIRERKRFGDERTKLLPVAVLTSWDEERNIVGSYRLGANSFVRKPVEFEQFADAVCQLRLYWLLLNQPPHERR